MNIYKRREDESFVDWKARLVLGKLDKTIDLDWIEIAEMLGLDCSADHLRKTAYGFKEAYEHYESKLEDGIEDHNLINKLEQGRIEFEKEKKRFQDQRRELKKLYDHDARHEHLRNEFMQVFSDMDSYEFNFNPRNYNPLDKDGVLILSDWHVGLKTENYWNKYDINEFYRRIEDLVEKTIEYGRFHNINKLHVFGLGDLCNGLIHISTRISNEEDVVKQIKIVSETLASMLSRFSDEFKEVEFYSVSGNHGRVSPNKHDSIEKENFEEFVMWYLEAKLDNIPNVNLNKNTYDDGIIVADVIGHTCLGVHGDKDRITNVAQNLSLMLKTVPEYIFTADKHHLEENEIHGVEVIINRSLSGVDEYAKNIRKTSSAGQAFMVFDRKIGRECTYNIKLN